MGIYQIKRKWKWQIFVHENTHETFLMDYVFHEILIQNETEERLKLIMIIVNNW